MKRKWCRADIHCVVEQFIRCVACSSHWLNWRRSGNEIRTECPWHPVCCCFDWGNIVILRRVLWSLITSTGEGAWKSKKTKKYYSNSRECSGRLQSDSSHLHGTQEVQVQEERSYAYVSSHFIICLQNHPTHHRYCGLVFKLTCAWDVTIGKFVVNEVSLQSRTSRSPPTSNDTELQWLRPLRDTNRHIRGQGNYDDEWIAVTSRGWVKLQKSSCIAFQDVHVAGMLARVKMAECF